MIDVAAGVIRDARGRILLCQRTGRLNGLWEFPGGKREPGESFADCLRRELREELALEVRPTGAEQPMDYREGDKAIHFAFVEAVADSSALLTLRVHSAAVWAEPAAIDGYALCPADRAYWSFVIHSNTY